MQHRQNLTRAVISLREAAKAANAAVERMARAAATTNPDRMLRCWTAARTAEASVAQAKAAKGKASR